MYVNTPQDERSFALSATSTSPVHAFNSPIYASLFRDPGSSKEPNEEHPTACVVWIRVCPCVL